MHHTDEEHIAQQTVMRVLRYFQSGGGLNNPAALPGFVWSICRNVCLEKERLRGKSLELENILDQLPQRDRNLLQALFGGEETCEDTDGMCRRFGVTPGYRDALKKMAIGAARRLADKEKRPEKPPGGPPYQ
jgi:hypothetical protein